MGYFPYSQVGCTLEILGKLIIAIHTKYVRPAEGLVARSNQSRLFKLPTIPPSGNLYCYFVLTINGSISM